MSVYKHWNRMFEKGRNEWDGVNVWARALVKQHKA